jgi:hypothetical protein
VSAIGGQTAVTAHTASAIALRLQHTGRVPSLYGCRARGECHRFGEFAQNMPESLAMKGFLLMLVGGAVLVHAALPTTVSAQSNELKRQLENASRVECTFTTLVTGDWEDGATSATAATAEFEAAFFDIDVDSGTAEAEGRFGASYIIVRYAEGYLHFMQTLTAGPIYLTTILAEPSREGRLKAVHTRHEYTSVMLPGFTSRPEMYIGDCAVE